MEFPCCFSKKKKFTLLSPFPTAYVVLKPKYQNKENMHSKRLYVEVLCKPFIGSIMKEKRKKMDAN